MSLVPRHRLFDDAQNRMTKRDYDNLSVAEHRNNGKSEGATTSEIGTKSP